MLKKIKNKVYFWRVTTSKCHPFGGMAHLLFMGLCLRKVNIFVLFYTDNIKTLQALPFSSLICRKGKLVKITKNVNAVFSDLE